MKKMIVFCVGMLLGGAVLSLPAAADPWEDESGHGRGYYGGHYEGGDHKQEYWDGNCKVERKWKGNGDYKEERKCKGPRYYERPGVAYPVHPQPGIVVDPGIVIQGTAVIR